MKKLISLLAVFALLAALPLSVFADPAVVLTMEDVSVAAGTQTVTLTLVCQSSVLVGDGQVTVIFSADKLQLTKAASPLAETAVNTRKAAEGRVQFGFMTGEGISGDTALLTLGFKIKNPDEATSYTVTATSRRMSDLNYHNLIDPEASLSVAATVTVTPKLVDPQILQLKEQLEALVARQIDESQYTAASVTAYNALVGQANQLLQNTAVTVAALQEMIDQLNTVLVELPPVDPEVAQLKEELLQLMEEKIDESQYIPQSVVAYKALLTQAETLLQSATVTASRLRAIIELMTSTLEPLNDPDAEIRRLKEELTELIGQSIDESKYTPESVEEYKTLKEQAAALTADPAAIAAGLQGMIDQLKSVLKEKLVDAVTMGDVDGDKNITSTDARLVLQKAVDKIKEADMPVPAAADVDGDGTVTSTDARLILQKAVGKIQGFEGL